MLIEDLYSLYDESIHPSNLNVSRIREYLGCSSLGNICDRKIWMLSKGYQYTTKSIRTNRIMERGRRVETEIISDLKECGYTITNQQYEVVYDENPSIKGHIEGLIMKIDKNNIIVVPLHLFEIKSHNDASFKMLSKSNVLKSHREHYIQIQVYLYLLQKDGFNVTQCIYIAFNKNNEDLYEEIINYNEECALTYLVRAKHILTLEGIPLRPSDNPNCFMCKNCPFNSICFNEEDREEDKNENQRRDN